MGEPFLKWPGGKRWLTRQYDGLFPATFERYIEPFLGGGAVFFHLAPRQAILADSNRELINVYQCLKKQAKVIDKRVAALQKMHSADLYYRLRAELPADPVKRAVRFLYLNRTCFNGIYRVNLKGEFNVPMGSKNRVEYPKGFLETVGNNLRNASIHDWDFEKTIDKAESGDFVYIDPPYTVMHNNNNFVKYNSKLFSWDDQVRLAKAVIRASERGAKIMLSNADHKSVQKLYKGFGDQQPLDRASILAAVPEHRRRTTELIVMNYAAKEGAQAER
jgi:DNA adenine methylase